MTLVKRILIILFIVVLADSNHVNAQNKNSNALIPWKFKTSGKIVSSPVIKDNVLYIGSSDSCMYAIDITTGNEKWHYKTQNQILSTASICDNIICFESGDILYGINLQGTFEWKVVLYNGTCTNMFDQWDYYHSSPRIVGDVAYIGTEKGLIYGINVKTGKIVFQCQTPTAQYAIKTTPAIYDNKIYVGDWDGVLYVYDLTTANLVWKYDTKDDKKFKDWVNAIVTDPVIVDNNLYFAGRSCCLYCLDAKTGSKKWSWREPNDCWIVGGPTVSNGIVYTGGSYQHSTSAYNAANGSLLWNSLVTYRVNGAPLSDDKYVYVGTEADETDSLGSFCVVDKSNGKVLSNYKINSSIYSSPLLYNGLIYYGSTDGYVYAISQKVITNVPVLNFKGDTNFGKIESGHSVDAYVYIYNTGLIEDSVSIKSSINQLSLTPSEFKLAPQDTQKVIVKIDAASLAAKRYMGSISIVSNKSISPSTMTKSIAFTVVTPSAVQDDDINKESFVLEQNYPNPFNPCTTINYQIPAAPATMGETFVSLKVFDLLGKEVATLVNENQRAGKHSCKFSCSNYNLTSGVYFYQLQVSVPMGKAGSFSETRKLTLMK